MPVEFDPVSSTFFEDPLEVYRSLRDEAPLYLNEQYGFYALSRYEDVIAAHKDWETFSSAHGVDLEHLFHDPDQVRSLRSIIMMDPPDHTVFRALVSRVFTPRAIAALEPMVREVIGGFAAELSGARSFDAVRDFSGPFPVEVISNMLGVPEGERQQLRHWLDIMLTREVGEINQPAAGVNASISIGTYFYGLTQQRRADPGDDVLSRLVQATVRREDGEETGLTDPEIAGFTALLGGAGAETVTKLVANAFVLFARYPDQWNLVREDPSRIPAAVEEILRYLPPSQYQGRFTTKDVEIAGGTIPAGYPVLLLTGAATRDERFFDRADEFDIDRPASHALGFGLGIHSCLGAALARIESRVAIEEMVQRWPSFEIDEAGLERVAMTNVAGYSSVPVNVL